MGFSRPRPAMRVGRKNPVQHARLPWLHGQVLFEQSRDVILFVRVSDGRILEANPAAEQAYGYTRQELLGLSIRDLRAPETQTLVDLQLRQASQTGILFETLHRRKDGSIFPVEVNSHGTEIDGVIVNLSVIRDISERRRAEDALQRRWEELEFLADISGLVYTAETQAELLSDVLDRISAVLNTRGAALAFPDPQNADWVIESGQGEWRSAPGTRIPGGIGMGPRVASSQHYHFCNTVTSDPQLSAQERATGVKCLFCIALVTDGRSVGLLYLGRDTPFLQSDARLVVAAVDMVAGALKRFELNQQALHHLDMLMALRTVDQSILNNLHLDDTLMVLLEKITKLLGVDAADILLYYPRLQILKASRRWGMSPSYLWDEHLNLGESHAGQIALTRRMEWLPDLSVIHDSLTEKIQATGDRFACYMGIPLEAKGELKGVLQVFHRSPLNPSHEWLDFLQSLAGQAAIAIDNALLRNEQAETNQRLIQAYDKTIEGWSRALDLRDQETGDHSQRLANLTLALARRVGIKEEELVHLRRGAQLHDIGKMGIPDSILRKKGKLSDEEWVIMRRHPAHAIDLLLPIEFLSPALEIPYSHHEKWNGSGYPLGLRGEEIPLAARIFAVVDVWDALTHDRTYRPAWTQAEALEYIRAQSGEHFDPRIVQEFLSLIAEGSH
jgi:PAS domain S-box-containing protein